MGLAARAGLGPRGASVIGEGQEGDVMIPLITQAARILQRQQRHGPHVFTQLDGPGILLGSGGHGRHSHAKQAEVPGVSLHTLDIPSLVQAGRPLPEVARLTGHRDIKLTRCYAPGPESLAGRDAGSICHRPHGTRYPQTIVSRCHVHFHFWDARKCW